MDETKPFWQSRGVWGAVVATACGVAMIWGYHVSPADQGQAVELIYGAVTTIAGAIALWGRVRATKTIGGAK